MPKLILLDGPPGSGKSRLKSALLDALPDLKFCPRVTTRAPRDSDSDDDYRFISAQEFEELENAGQLAAFRHFDFGMSYGLPRATVERALSSGKDVLCLIDLGTIQQAKTCWPHATGVLLYAPLDQLRSRLEARAVHTAEQIDERIENAAKVWRLRHSYQEVIVNEDGRWEQTLARMLNLLSS